MKQVYALSAHSKIAKTARIPSAPILMVANFRLKEAKTANQSKWTTNASNQFTTKYAQHVKRLDQANLPKEIYVQFEKYFRTQVKRI